MRFCRGVLIVLLSLLLQACASTPYKGNGKLNPELEHVLSYKERLEENHPDQLDKLFFVPDQMLQEVQSRFGHLQSSRAASTLAKWLIDPDGYNLVYDISANLKPSNALEEKRGNCLSFTLLLIELADSINVEIRPNQVDLPDTWGDSGEDNLVFYRHINGIHKNYRQTQVLDLAIQDYDFAYPQRVISKEHAAALLFSNKGVDGLKENNYEKAFHYLKLSISHYPNNPDMWINLGAAYKSAGQLDLAEASFLHALGLRDRNNLAASNLERLYRSEGQQSKARHYAKKAERARKRNPYYQFKVAQSRFKQSHYDDSLNAVQKAIRFHNKDHRFFDLRSRIHFVKRRYVEALKDLDKAFRLAREDSYREEYQERVQNIIARIEKIALQQDENSDSYDGRQVRYEDLIPKLVN